MAQNKPVYSGTANNYKNNSGGAVLISEPVIGVVKNNIDPSKCGRIQVFLSNVGVEDPDDSNNWVTVSYLSPFYGVSTTSKDLDSTGSDTTGYGKFVENPQSYGFWATAPDLGTEVICIFVNGDPNYGFYIGCIPKSGLLQMTPGLGSSNVVVPNKGESETYGGADRLPVGEVNYANPNLKNSPTIATDPKPVQSYQASILLQQGLVRDNIRGTISSSAQRETPSRVFGISTPGRTIYSGGYNNSNIKQAAQTADQSKLQSVGKTGGHSMVMDDGTIDGKDQLMRFRTADGHQIIMSDSGQTLFICHANGQSWIELGKEGTIDMFSTNSVNIRTQGDLNLHADRDVNINAKRNFNFYAKDANLETDNNLNIRSGATFAQYSVGKYTVKSDGDLSLLSGGTGSLASSGTTYINGAKVNLNTGQTGTVPVTIPVIPKVNHLDTAFSTSKGWMFPSPTALLSVTTRTPTHQPWAEAGKGVDVKVSSAVNSSVPVTTTVTDQVNTVTSNTPKKAVTTTVASTVPTQPPINSNLGTPVTTTLAAQQAVNNSTLPDGRQPTAARRATNQTARTSRTGETLTVTAISGLGEEFSDIVYDFGDTGSSTNALTKRGAGILPGPGGVTLTQATAPGQILKPGSESLVQARIAQGMPYEKAIQGLVTGNWGATSPLSVLRNTSVQLSAVSNSIIGASTQLRNAGILTGQEAAGQAGGLILATANYGINTVTGVIAGIGATVAGTINAGVAVVQGVANTVTQVANTAVKVYSKASQVVESISSGKYAGQLSDSLSNGLSGLASSVSSAISSTVAGLGKSIAAATTALQGTLRNAFNTIEKSYQNLTANAPNVLGDGEVIEPSIDPSSAGAQYAAAEQEITVTEELVFSATKAYRNSATPENYQALQEAEKRASQARQRGASASSSFLSGGINSAIDSVSNTFNSVGQRVSGIFKSQATSANSGINSLPGGLSSSMSQVQSSAGNVVNNVKNSVRQVGTGNLQSASGLTGNLVDNTIKGISNAATGVVNTATGIVTGVVSGVVNTATTLVNTALNLPAQIVKSVTASVAGIASSIQGALSAVGKAGGQIKSAIVATETFVKTEIVSKQGQVNEDPRIPAPLASIPTKEEAAPYVESRDIGDQLKTQSELQREIRTNEDEIQVLQRRVAELDASRKRPVPRSMDRGTNAAVERAYSAAVEQLAAANEKLYQTEIKYQTEVNGQNSQSVGPPKQSGWSKFWNGDRSDPNKYFQF
jgi:hypothetical protein